MATSDGQSELRSDALEAWHAGLHAVEPERAVAAARQDLRSLLDPDSATLVVATGKAAAAMMRGLGTAVSGYCLLPTGTSAEGLVPAVQVLRGGHPVPTEEGLRASRTILDAVSALGAEQRLLYLVSGGSSALFEVPAEGVSAADLIAAYEVLLGCGAPIDEINCVRRQLSRIKGGGLARAAAPAAVLTLAVSDVAGDDPATIGSGPTVESLAAPARALAIVDAYGLRTTLPATVLQTIEGKRETVREGATEPLGGASGSYHVVACNRHAAAAAATRIEELGYVVEDAGVSSLDGDCAELAEKLATAIEDIARKAANSDRRFAIVIGGEPTVRLGSTSGEGGRCQHLAAILAGRLSGRGSLACVAAGTDGRDGNSDAAGAVIDGETAERASRSGYELEAALAAFDSGRALAAIGDLVVTGPTGTNVGDLLVAVAAAGEF